jgi:hypothetical protein
MTRNLEVLELGQNFQREESTKQREQAMEIVKMQMRWAGVSFSEEKEDDNGRYVTVTNTKDGTVKNVYLDNVVVPEETITANDGSTIGYGTDKSGNLTVDFWPTGVVRSNRWQCWEVVNDISGIGMWNYYTEKLTKTQKWKTPQVGDVFVSPRGVMYNGKQTWHTWFVKTVFPDGSIELWESNLVKDKNGKGITSTRIIKPTDAYYKELQFWKTKMSRDWGAVKVADKAQEAIDRAKAWAKSNGKWEDFAKSFERNFKKYGAGSQEVYDDLASFAAASETWTSGLKIAETIRSQKKLDDVFKMVDEYEKNGGDVNDLFGLKWDVKKITDRLKSSLSSGTNIPESTKTKISLEVRVLELMQEYRRSMTGAAASILESEEYKKIFPDGKDGTQISLSMLGDYWKRVQQDLRNGLSTIYGASSVDALLPPQKRNFDSLNDSKYSTSNTNYALPPWMQWLSSYLNN